MLRIGGGGGTIFGGRGGATVGRLIGGFGACRIPVELIVSCDWKAAGAPRNVPKCCVDGNTGPLATVIGGDLKFKKKIELDWSGYSLFRCLFHKIYLGDLMLWCLDTAGLLPLPFLAAIICCIPGGFGAQFGLPWFGTGLCMAPVLFVPTFKLLLLLSLLLLILLILFLILLIPVLFALLLFWLFVIFSTVGAGPFPNSDDLFGVTPLTAVKFVALFVLKSRRKRKLMRNF